MKHLSILVILFLLPSILLPQEEVEDSLSKDTPLTLILDQTEELVEFRTMNSPYPAVGDLAFELPTRRGMEDLKYSGSGQFSENGLLELQEKLNQKDLIIVDLRRESHGFINGLPVSWMNLVNGWSNIGLSTNAIIDTEKALLKEAEKEKHVVIHKVIKDENKKELIPMPTTVLRTSTERNLTAKHGLGYVRIPISDHKRPSNQEVDTFLDFYNNKPDDAWVHFHCKGGNGRTSTFMVMVDMMNNAKSLSFNTIMKRQMLINDADFIIVSTYCAKQFIIDFTERLLFLEGFYDYCKDNDDHFTTPWTTYLKSKNYQVPIPLSTNLP